MERTTDHLAYNQIDSWIGETLGWLKVLLVFDTSPVRGQNNMARTFGAVPVDVRNAIQSHV